MRKRTLIVLVLALLLVLPPGAWLLNQWAYARWSQHVLDIAESLRTGAPTRFSECPAWVVYAKPGEVRIGFEPPRIAWLARWDRDALDYNSYSLTLSEYAGVRKVTISHGSD
jgi:hypothetical protein